MDTLGTAGCFPAGGRRSHLSTWPRVRADARLLRGWETLLGPTPPPAATQGGPGPLLRPAQAEDATFRCPGTQQLAFLVGSLLQATACSAASLGLAAFFPRLQTHLGSFPARHYTCPLLRRDPARLPPSTGRRRREGCWDPHSPPCAWAAGPPVPSPARSSQVVRKAQQLPLFYKWDSAEKKKKVALHPSKCLGGCFRSTAQATSLLHWLQGAPAAPGFGSGQQLTRPGKEDPCHFQPPGVCTSRSALSVASARRQVQHKRHGRRWGCSARLTSCTLVG